MKRQVLTTAAVASAALILFSGPSAFAQPEPESAAASTLAGNVQSAVDDGATTAAQVAAAVGLPADGPISLADDSAGRLAVNITFSAKPTAAQVEAVAAIAQVDRVNTFTPTISATVEPTVFSELASIDGVISVDPVLTQSRALAGGIAAPAPGAANPADCTPFPSDSSAPLAADLARLDYGVDGSGVKVGIISDSYARATTISSPQQDVEAGALPGEGNPCGWTTPVEVLKEGPANAADEGRAMAQLVHGIAPGADLSFASGAGFGAIGMAESVVLLARNGATVIVDDLGFPDEPVYQQGVLSSAIEYVEREYGVAYYSAAGNNNVTGRGPSAGLPIAGWETDAYRPTACPAWIALPTGVTSADCLDFDPESGAQAWDVLSFNGSERPIPMIGWGEPVNGVTTDMIAQLYRIDGPTRQLIGSTTRATSNIPNSVFIYDNPSGPNPDGDYALVLLRNTTQSVPTTTPPVWLSFFNGQDSLTSRQFNRSSGVDRVGRTAYGHEADGSNIVVGAAPVSDPTKPEWFSAIGTGKLYFEPFDPTSATPAPAYATPVEVPSPQIMGVDAARTTFFGAASTEGGQTVYRFSGTSAAAPSVAAVHALAQSYLGRPDARLIEDAIARSARAMTNPYSGKVPDAWILGAGLAQADKALAELPQPAPGPGPGPVPAVLASTGPGLDPILGGIAAGVFLLGGVVLMARRRRLSRG